MSKSPVRMVLAGEDTAGLRAFRLISSGESVAVVAVISGSSDATRGATVAQVAGRLGIPVWPPSMLRDPATANVLRGEGVDILLNVHGLVLIDTNVLEAPTLGSFNLHPGPLPRYAGLNSPCWGVYHQEHEFGVTLHRMTAVVDTGPIAGQMLFAVESRETGLSLTSKTVTNGTTLLGNFLAQLLESSASVPAREQDLSQREYLGAGPPHGGRLLWELPATQLDAFVRACDFGPFESPWGHPLVSWESSQMAVRSARAADASEKDAPPGTVVAVDEEGASVTSGDGLLIVESLEVGGQICAASEVLRAGRRFDIA
jgi:methionyl-tRNA formyltransferase